MALGYVQRCAGDVYAGWWWNRLHAKLTRPYTRTFAIQFFFLPLRRIGLLYPRVGGIRVLGMVQWCCCWLGVASPYVDSVGFQMLASTPLQGQS